MRDCESDATFAVITHLEGLEETELNNYSEQFIIDCYADNDDICDRLVTPQQILSWLRSNRVPNEWQYPLADDREECSLVSNDSGALALTH